MHSRESTPRCLLLPAPARSLQPLRDAQIIHLNAVTSHNERYTQCLQGLLEPQLKDAFEEGKAVDITVSWISYPHKTASMRKAPEMIDGTLWLSTVTGGKVPGWDVGRDVSMGSTNAAHR